MGNQQTTQKEAAINTLMTERQEQQHGDSNSDEHGGQNQQHPFRHSEGNRTNYTKRRELIIDNRYLNPNQKQQKIQMSHTNIHLLRIQRTKFPNSFKLQLSNNKDHTYYIDNDFINAKSVKQIVLRRISEDFQDKSKRTSQFRLIPQMDLFQIIEAVSSALAQLNTKSIVYQGFINNPQNSVLSPMQNILYCRDGEVKLVPNELLTIQRQHLRDPVSYHTYETILKTMPQISNKYEPIKNTRQGQKNSSQGVQNMLLLGQIILNMCCVIIKGSIQEDQQSFEEKISCIRDFYTEKLIKVIQTMILDEMNPSQFANWFAVKKKQYQQRQIRTNVRNQSSNSPLGSRNRKENKQTYRIQFKKIYVNSTLDPLKRKKQEYNNNSPKKQNRENSSRSPRTTSNNDKKILKSAARPTFKDSQNSNRALRIKQEPDNRYTFGFKEQNLGSPFKPKKTNLIYRKLPLQPASLLNFQHNYQKAYQVHKNQFKGSSKYEVKDTERSSLLNSRRQNLQNRHHSPYIINKHLMREEPRNSSRTKRFNYLDKDVVAYQNAIQNESSPRAYCYENSTHRHPLPSENPRISHFTHDLIMDDFNHVHLKKKYLYPRDDSPPIYRHQDGYFDKKDSPKRNRNSPQFKGKIIKNSPQRWNKQDHYHLHSAFEDQQARKQSSNTIKKRSIDRIHSEIKRSREIIKGIQKQRTKNIVNDNESNQ